MSLRALRGAGVSPAGSYTTCKSQTPAPSRLRDPPLPLSRLFDLASWCSRTRRGLAAGTKMAAPPRDDHAADLFPAAKAGLPFPLVDTMTLLEFAAIPCGIHVVRN